MNLIKPMKKLFNKNKSNDDEMKIKLNNENLKLNNKSLIKCFSNSKFLSINKFKSKLYQNNPNNIEELNFISNNKFIPTSIHHISYNNKSHNSISSTSYFPPENSSTHGVTSTASPTSVPFASTEVQSNSLRLADSSSNYLSLKGRATPGDRGVEKVWIGPQVEVEPETIYGSRGEVNKKATTASGKEGVKEWTSYGPVADLREAKGEVNKGAVCKTDLEWNEQTYVIPPESDLWELEGDINGRATTASGMYNHPLAENSPDDVTATRSPAESSSNYFPLKSKATPGDRGEESETINGSRGEVNREATTASGMKSSTEPRVEPGSDLRELEGEVNREADGRTTLGGTASGKRVVLDSTLDIKCLYNVSNDNILSSTGILIDNIKPKMCNDIKIELIPESGNQIDKKLDLISNIKYNNDNLSKNIIYNIQMDTISIISKEINKLIKENDILKLKLNKKSYQLKSKIIKYNILSHQSFIRYPKISSI